MKRRMMKRLIFILSLALPLLCMSCNKKAEQSPERAEYIRVYDSADSELPIDSAWVSVKGGTLTYYIRSNVAFDAKWQNEGKVWARIQQPKKLSDDLWSVSLTADPISDRVYSTTSTDGLYTYRYGVLMLTAPSLQLGKYFVVEQGYVNRIACDFSWLFGSADPNAAYSDVVMDRWTAAQQSQGFTSTPIPGQDHAWVYSKDGYVRLGNNKGYGADLMTPHTAAFQEDSLLILSFRAVSQSGADLPDFTGGTEPIVPMGVMCATKAGDDAEPVDDNHLRVEILDGGFIRDKIGEKGTSIDFDLSSYNRESPNYPADIFDSGRYMVFLAGTLNNPINVNTTVRFVAGSMSETAAEKNNRVFIDDIFIYRIDPKKSEDPFILYGSRSGKDKLMGE